MANLGRKLWKAIEKPQGYAFIGDDIEDQPDAVVLERAAAALRWERRCARVLADFIKANSPPSQDGGVR